jgi:hypothetical protein
MKIVLVSARNFQEYILDNLRQLFLYGNTDVTVITEEEFFDRFAEFPSVELVDTKTLVGEKSETFDRNTTLGRDMWNGFWLMCSMRFFYIYEYMKQFDKTGILHMENDVLLYVNADTLRFTEDKVYATFDNSHRVIPGIMYIPNADFFGSILDRFDPGTNDMGNLGKFGTDDIQRLPIAPSDCPGSGLSTLFDDFKCVFDAAAIGQYLGGVDPRNRPHDSRGFVNETSQMKPNYYTFRWSLGKDRLWRPYLITPQGIRHPIANLHIHSKTLDRFMTDNPLEDSHLIVREIPEIQQVVYETSSKVFCSSRNQSGTVERRGVLGCAGSIVVVFADGVRRMFHENSPDLVSVSE